MTACNRIFNRLSNPSTVTYWNSTIRKAVQNGCNQNALLLFRQMKQSGLEPDNLTLPFVAKACSRLATLQTSEIIHSHVLKSPFSSDIFVQTTAVDMYIKCSRLDLAHKLFDEMPVRDVASWNVILMGFSQSGHLESVAILFRHMRLADVKPDCITVISLTQLSSNLRNLITTQSVHCLGMKIGVEADVSVANTWIVSYAKCDDLVLAEFVFNEIPVAMRTTVTWNSVISGHAHFGRFVEAVDYFNRMCRDGDTPDLSTFLSLLSSFTHLDALLQGKQIHSHVIKEGFDSDVSLLNTLISMYSKCGDVVSSRYLFDNMSKRTVVSWTAMIAGYAQKGDLDEGLNLFQAMERGHERPDEVTVVALLSACSQTGALEIGNWLNSYVITKGFGENIMITNALIDMHAKCGNVYQAREIFDYMTGRTIVSWTTMIAGYAMSGYSKDALDLFSQMMDLGLRPNHITFLAALQACAHAGLLEEGWKCFDLMKMVYQVRPRLEHYACMVDLLGRRGRVKQALEFVLNMPVRPDAGVWGALLGACMIHRDVKVGEYVAHQLFKLEPNKAVSYVAMANIYAAEGRWDAVAKMRARMKCKELKKSPGQSLLQVNGKLHIFIVEDRSHSEGLHIYEVLDGLALQLKEVGLEPSLESNAWE